MQLNLNLCPGCMEPKSEGAVCPVCGYSAGTPYDTAYLAPGTALNGRYLAGKLLHRNGESAVYIGYDSVNGTKVLIKEYMPDTLCKRVKDSSVVAVNQNAVAQYKTFMSEFVELNKTLAKLRNVNHINPAVDMFGDNNTGYVVFNFIEGIPLTDHIRGLGGVLTWEQVRKLFPPLFTTLSQIHNAGLVHRGICPDNIIVTPRDELILTGFCVADERTAETELNSEIYDGYAAPEQYSSGKWQGTWTDVYGICALLYRMLTGTTPVDAMVRMTNDTLVEPRSLNGNIPANVSKVI
ncbi:MAG: protein kinase, partial [Oscillospiraceae bacterium]|nr:protein kinase [Oscillospiraceae bacterium]